MRQRANEERDRDIIRKRQAEETGRKRERERRDMKSMGAIESETVSVRENLKEGEGGGEHVRTRGRTLHPESLNVCLCVGVCLSLSRTRNDRALL